MGTVLHKDYFWLFLKTLFSKKICEKGFKNGAIGSFILRQNQLIIVSFPQLLNIFSKDEQSLKGLQLNHLGVCEI